MIHDILLVALWLASALGCLFMLFAAALMWSSTRPQPATEPAPDLTILKPLHGDEAGLYENLASFCEQDYSGAVQIVFGVENPNDPAIAVVERLRAAYPGKALELVIEPRAVGSNPKVANLINMSGRIAHDVIVLADSDIRVRRDYLARLVGALERQGGGAVSCPYYGISTGSLWSQLAQLTIDSHFLPGVVVGARLKLSQPCLGSTIALRRSSLSAIGGFEPLADCLADDYVLGELLRERGEPVSVLSFAVGHVCAESSIVELWRHELRWALTIRTVDPLGYLGWTVSHAFPLALIAWLLGGSWPAIVLAVAALVCRAVLISATERGYGLPPHPYWLIPVRDLLSFAVFVAGFVARDVSWRGHHYELMSEGILKSDRRSRPP
jgi:ceramide glucosyltransferase